MMMWIQKQDDGKELKGILRILFLLACFFSAGFGRFFFLLGRFSPLFLLLLFLHLFSTFSLSYSAITLKCATIAPSNSDWANIMKKASEEIQTKTQDSVKITWYFSGAAGDEPEVAKKLKQGEIDCAALTGNGISYVIPFMRLLELPFLFRSYDEVSYIKDEMQKLFAKISADYNVKFISFADLGFVYIFSKQPISNIDDIKGKTLWVWKNDFLAEYIGNVLKRIFGIKVISLPLSDVKQYLDSIEILYNAPYPLIVFGWDTGVKYYLTPPLNFSFTAILINQKSSEQIPPQFRDVVESTLKKYIDSVSDMNMKNNEKALEMFEKKGLKKISFPQSEIDKAEKIFRDEVWTPLKDKLYPSWLITQILTKISEFRAKQR